MAFEIIATTNGPLVSYNGNMIALNDHQDMIDAAEANDTLISSMLSHITAELTAAVNLYMDGIANNMTPQPARIFAYINAAQQYSAWKNHHWNAYQAALSNAQASTEG
jgi:hypothetical protein